MRAFFKVLAWLMLVVDGVVVAQEVRQITGGLSVACVIEGHDDPTTFFVPSDCQVLQEGAETLEIIFSGGEYLGEVADIGGYLVRHLFCGEKIPVVSTHLLFGEPGRVGRTFSKIIFTGDIWPHDGLMDWIMACDAARAAQGLEELDVEWRKNKFV